MLFEALGKPNEVEAGRTCSRNLDPKEQSAHFLLGFLLSELNYLPERSSTYEKAVELEAWIFMIPYYNCALMYATGEREKKYAATKGIPHYQKHLARQPETVLLK